MSRPASSWGDDLRRRKVARCTLRRRASAIGALVAIVTASAAWHPAPRLVWNASASAPIGLYLVTPNGEVRRGDMVIARVPIAVRELAAARHYIPIDVPLVKHVGAVPGDTICARGTVITIDGKAIATRRESDSLRRPMPWWSGCQLLRQGNVFLLSPDVAASFDGRYFGVSSTADVVGTARPLWMR